MIPVVGNAWIDEKSNMPGWFALLIPKPAVALGVNGRLTSPSGCLRHCSIAFLVNVCKETMPWQR